MVLLQLPILLLLLLAFFTTPSCAVYCVCKDGMSNQAMQNDIDYACGSGADCGGILQSGSCYQPNTIKDHCNYAVNSYFQRKGQVPGSCDFSGTATTSSVPPTNQVAGCVYQASPSSTPTLTPTIPTTTGTTPTTTTGTIPTTGSTTPTTVFTPGLGPTGGTGINDSGALAVTLGWGGSGLLGFLLLLTL
ncbi:hypothetical protein MLD38_024356 [Melastoma candidum]|uniref:Uncharacterized protein n=1 Tax=Melastoma candidum TaxID=119954 RepID=A0ACB9NV19_9MYRT|nr:hypothetical protein MLD38_024356 [Melastoma candidum]